MVTFPLESAAESLLLQKSLHQILYRNRGFNEMSSSLLSTLGPSLGNKGDQFYNQILKTQKKEILKENW